MAYTKTTWVDDSDPYLNATNLNKIEQGIEDATDTADGAVQKSGDTMTGALIVPAPSAATQVPRLARTPNAATGDLGLPGYAGSDTGWRDVSSLASPETGITAATIHARRHGTQVSIKTQMTLDHGSVPQGTVLNLYTPEAPAGFKVVTNRGLLVRGQYSSSSFDGHDFLVQGWAGQPWVLVRRDMPTSSWVRFLCTYATDDPWPTSLPGTQVTPPASWT